MNEMQGIRDAQRLWRVDQPYRAERGDATTGADQEIRLAPEDQAYNQCRAFGRRDLAIGVVIFAAIVPVAMVTVEGNHVRVAGPAGSAGLATQQQPDGSVAGYPVAFLSLIAARPAATFRPAVPSMLTGCSETVLPVPPTNTFALPPMPAAAPAVTPA
jgi:hypothetical protein